MTQTADTIVETARAHRLELTPTIAELDETGFDFAVLHAVDADGLHWIVRSPRRAEAMERAATERAKLDLVRGRLPVEVPEWRIYSDTIIAYPRLSGEPAAVVDMSAGGYVWRFEEKSAPESFVDSLARALAALHAIDRDAARSAGMEVLAPDDVRARYAASMERTRSMLKVPEPVWSRWMRWLEDRSFWPDHSVVVHGDLHPGHLLVDDAHAVTGVLDWTEAHVGDPASDLRLLHATMGSDAMRRLVERYAAHGGRVWPRMLEHVAETWAAYPTMIVEFVDVSGVDAPLALAQVLIDTTAAEVA